MFVRMCSSLLTKPGALNTSGDAGDEQEPVVEVKAPVRRAPHLNMPCVPSHFPF